MTRSKTTYLIAGLVVIAVVILLAWKWAFRPSESSVGSHKAEISMQASDLVMEFTTNEESANSKYLNKIIELKGIVNAVEVKDQEVTVYLRKEKDLSGVLCSFDKTAIDPAVIKKGEEITIKGLCSGYLMDVVFNKCAIE
ncbi:MAG TPA: hypothetical protein VHO90_05305 [Bacteroidales bacterium]|nr:hypothetical protein [Bacteroidales bacterium]